MPGEQRIGCHQRLQLIKCPSTRHFSLYDQSYALFVGEAKPLSFELFLEHTVLFDEIVDDYLVLALKPAGQSAKQQMEGLYDVGHCTNRLSVILPDNNIIRLVRICAPYDRV